MDDTTDTWEGAAHFGALRDMIERGHLDEQAEPDDGDFTYAGRDLAFEPPTLPVRYRA
jgi:hypothetical protein